MLTISENLDYQNTYAVTRYGGTRRPAAFLFASILGGAFIGLADVFMMAAAGPLKEAGSPWTPLIAGSVFGIGLILCVFAGGELATSAMMTFTIGAWNRAITWVRGAGALAFMLLGNLAGSIILAALVRATGVANEGGAINSFLVGMIAGKTHHTNTELFFRGIMCNILVCLAIWVVTRTTSEVGKMIVMTWCLAAFVAAGFEHVVANMTSFSLAILQGVEGATLVSMGRNLLLVGLGNIVGGAVFVAGAYLASRRIEEGAAEARAEAGVEIPAH